MMDVLMIGIALGLFALAIAYAHAIGEIEEVEPWFLIIRSLRSWPSACWAI